MEKDMKHIVGIILMVGLCLGLSAISFRLGVGEDTAGETISSIDGLLIGNKNEIAHTASFQMEHNHKNISYGLGVDYQFPRENRKLPDGWSSNIGKHEHIPVYGILSYDFGSTNKIRPSLVAQFGYDFAHYKFTNNDEDDRYKSTDGLFYGYGISFAFDNFSLALLHRTNNSTIIWEQLESGEWVKNSDFNLATRQINLSLGYRFKVH